MWGPPRAQPAPLPPDLRGREYNSAASPAATQAMGGAIIRATAEAAEHPGLYVYRTDDIPTIQLTLRPGWVADPEWLEEVGFLERETPPYG